MTAALAWTDALKVNIDFVDHDHEEFIALLNAAASADDAALPAAFDALLAHTAEHFAREEELMDRVGFFATECHKGEHARVLNEAKRFRSHLAGGNVAYVRAYLSDHLPQWFLLHRNTMDAATAAYALQHA